MKSISCVLSVGARIRTPPASTNCMPANGLAARIRGHLRRTQSANLAAARAFALADSSSRFFGGAFLSSECKKRLGTDALSAGAATEAASVAFHRLFTRPNFVDA